MSSSSPKSLDQFRADAKRLKKAFVANAPEAVARLRVFVPDGKPPKHADFLYVIARETGHASWPKLKFALEAAAMDTAQRARRLGQALFNGQKWVVEKLLGDDPDLVQHDFALQIATYDLAAIEKAVAADPGVATAKLKVLTPILALSFSQYIHMAPERRGDMLAIADLLVQHGADVNDGFAPDPEQDHKLSALYGALGHGNNIVLAEWLLAHGATPDDNESFYHATELGHLDGLRLLMRYGATVRGTNALPRALDFGNVEMVKLLLEYGADPNEAVRAHESGQPIDTIPALHQAARRWCSGEIAELLLDHGADPALVWKEHTPYAMARIFGNHAVADVLQQRGFETALSANEKILVECAAGVMPTARLDMTALGDEDLRLLTRVVAGPTPVAHMEALIAAGLDPDGTDEMDMPPLHVACWEGLLEKTAFLLQFSPDLTRENAYGGDVMGTVIHGSEHSPKAAERAHVACAQLLVAAGAVPKREDVDGCGNAEMVLFLEGVLAGD